MKTFHELMSEVKGQINEVDVDQAKVILDQGQAVFIDIREPTEWGSGIVRGAARIPRGVMELQIERFIPERSQEIVLYCAGGIRSALAARSLQEMGYENVKSMNGGFVVWEAAEYPIESAE